LEKAVKDPNVKFVRVKGRIVPIRLKQGSGSRGGKFHSKMSSRERGHMNQGAKEIKRGLIGATALFGLSLASRKLSKIANNVSIKALSKGMRSGKHSMFVASEKLRKTSKAVGSDSFKTGLNVAAAGSFSAGLVTNQDDFGKARSLGSKRAAKIRALNKKYGK
jgi:hypothetical protein